MEDRSGGSVVKDTMEAKYQIARLVVSERGLASIEEKINRGLE
ncbi:MULTISPECIES: hypothetical protein [Paraburkholderia]|jgi:hypothetical protein|uniref:Uncharacterized protein n=1 Tax=Paraburkholderia caribensis TaxID=75105 RepID=A0ABV0E998_9BURK|nr:MULTISPECIES: hypothetical protein [Paraburkholderia]